MCLVTPSFLHSPARPPARLSGHRPPRRSGAWTWRTPPPRCWTGTGWSSTTAAPARCRCGRHLEPGRAGGRGRHWLGPAARSSTGPSFKASTSHPSHPRPGPTPHTGPALPQATDLGRIASQYYVSYRTIASFNDHLKPTMGEIELLRLFALAEEFKYMVVREVRRVERPTGLLSVRME